MKGIVFTELLEMVEDQLGIEIADSAIAAAELENDGAYTAVGTYDHAELIRLVVAVSQQTGIPVAELVRAFGVHLFHAFAKGYPQFFAGVCSAPQFLPRIENYIHVEVRKLYADAELPRFQWEEGIGEYRLTYYSSRPFADLAEGLIGACIDFFGDPLEVRRIDLGNCDGTEACFVLSPR